MPIYAQITNNTIKQLFFITNPDHLEDIQDLNPDDLFVETEHFGDADQFLYVDGRVITKPSTIPTTVPQIDFASLSIQPNQPLP
jgi:hypothetical protein